MAHTSDFTARFGSPHAVYFGLLVVGRDIWLSHPREQRRWDWRAQKVLVNSLPVRCVTYDQLYRDLRDTLNLFSGAVHS